MNVGEWIVSWEMDADPDKLDNQIILAITGSNMRLRPDNWEQHLINAKKRIADRKAKAMQEATDGFEAAFKPKVTPEEAIS